MFEAYKEQLDLEPFPTIKLAISCGKSGSISMEWSFHESQSNAENRLLWPGTLLPAVYITLTSYRGIALARLQEHRLMLPQSQCQSFILNVMIFFTVTPQFHEIQQTCLRACSVPSTVAGAGDTDLNRTSLPIRARSQITQTDSCNPR